jgi:hypothetical protein
MDAGLYMLKQYACTFIDDYGRRPLPHTAQLVRTYLADRLLPAQKDAAMLQTLDDLEARLGGFRGWLYRTTRPYETRVVRDKIGSARALIARDDYSQVYPPLAREQEYWGLINHVQWAEKLLQPLIPNVPHDPTLEPAIKAWITEQQRIADNSKL